MALTIGARLLALKEHSRLSLAAIAARGGYSGASSIQKLFIPSYNPPRLSQKTADKLTKAFEGTGNPPIQALEVQALAGNSTELESLVAELSHYTHLTAKAISTFYTELVDLGLNDLDGFALQTFRFMPNQNGLHMPCPEHLQGKGLVAFFVSSTNLWPRFEPGELAIYEHRRPPVVGDDVVARVTIGTPDDRVLVAGRVQKTTDKELILEQLNPRADLRLDRASLRQVNRLVTRMELLPNLESVITLD